MLSSVCLLLQVGFRLVIFTASSGHSVVLAAISESMWMSRFIGKLFNDFKLNMCFRALMHIFMLPDTVTVIDLRPVCTVCMSTHSCRIAVCAHTRCAYRPAHILTQLNAQTVAATGSFSCFLRSTWLLQVFSIKLPCLSPAAVIWLP